MNLQDKAYAAILWHFPNSEIISRKFGWSVYVIKLPTVSSYLLSNKNSLLITRI